MKLTYITLTLAAVLACTAPASGEAAQGAIHVEGAWARSTPPNARTAAAYMTVTNAGHDDDTLVSVSTPVAGMADVHRTIDDNGVMKMRPAGPVELKPGASVKLSPGGYHIMLMQLKGPLNVGQSFPVTLVFKKAGAVTATVHVQNSAPSGAMNMQNMDHMGHMDHMNMK